MWRELQLLVIGHYTGRLEGAMDEAANFETMTDLCIAAHEAVAESGTPEMEATIKLLLFQIAREIIKRQTQIPDQLDGHKI